MDPLPFGMKSYTETPDPDHPGCSWVEWEYHWWFLPVAMFNRWFSLRFLRLD